MVKDDHAQATPCNQHLDDVHASLGVLLGGEKIRRSPEPSDPARVHPQSRAPEKDGLALAIERYATGLDLHAAELGAAPKDQIDLGSRRSEAQGQQVPAFAPHGSRSEALADPAELVERQVQQKRSAGQGGEQPTASKSCEPGERSGTRRGIQPFFATLASSFSAS